jgi:hypothetical protein
MSELVATIYVTTYFHYTIACDTHHERTAHLVSLVWRFSGYSACRSLSTVSNTVRHILHIFVTLCDKSHIANLQSIQDLDHWIK